MKKFLFACAIVGSLTLPKVSALDYCCPTQCDPCWCGDFNGFYFGGNIGVFSHTAHRNDLDGFFDGDTPKGFSSIDTRFEGGLQLGYDWQCGSKLFGVVGDWNWVNGNGRILEDPSDTPANVRNRERWFSTIRLRAGLTVCDALVYVTGGAAVTRFRDDWTSEVDILVNDHHTRWGWTGGVGTEYLLGCNWSIGAEFLFLQFSQRTHTFSGGTFAFSSSDSAWVGRVLLNYRFGDLFCCN